MASQTGYKLVDGSFPETPAPTPAQLRHALGFFHRILPRSFFSDFQAEFKMRERKRVVTLPVTVWLMIVQRLGAGTLAGALGELLAGNGWEVLEPCARVRDRNISPGTGGYSQARSRVPEELARRIARHTFLQLRAALCPDELRRRVFVVDGTSVRLPHTRALLEEYAPASNQRGDAHWPVMRVVTMHHAPTGLALDPCYGPMYGEHAVGEQELAEKMLKHLPPRSILIGDRNFGVFALAWKAAAEGHDVLFRMTEDRAKPLAGELVERMDEMVEWRPTAQVLRKHPELPRDAVLKGRLVAHRPEGARETLYLFTTLEETVETAVSLYGDRWSIETDLRSLKEQVRLHSLEAKTPRMAAVELLLAVAAYNLIRGVMEQAARAAGVQPRRLSYARAQACFWPFTRAVSGPCTPEQFERHWNDLIRAVGRCKLPNRKRASQPRAIWPKRSAFPFRKAASEEKTK